VRWISPVGIYNLWGIFLIVSDCGVSLALNRQGPGMLVVFQDAWQFCTTKNYPGLYAITPPLRDTADRKLLKMKYSSSFYSSCEYWKNQVILFIYSFIHIWDIYWDTWVITGAGNTNTRKLWDFITSRRNDLELQCGII